MVIQMSINNFHLILLGAKSSYNIWNDNSYPFNIINVHCYGNETKFIDCYYEISTSPYCYYYYYYYYYYYGAVAVFCQKSKCA